MLALFAPGFGFIKKRLHTASIAGESFALLPQTAFVPVVAIVYPRAIVEQLLAWASGEGWPSARPRALRGSDDAIVALFARAARLHIWATVPSLVDHRVDVASVARPAHGAGAHRQAAML